MIIMVVFCSWWIGLSQFENFRIRNHCPKKRWDLNLRPFKNLDKVGFIGKVVEEKRVRWVLVISDVYKLHQCLFLFIISNRLFKPETYLILESLMIYLTQLKTKWDHYSCVNSLNLSSGLESYACAADQGF